MKSTPRTVKKSSPAKAAIQPLLAAHASQDGKITVNRDDLEFLTKVANDLEFLAEVLNEHVDSFTIHDQIKTHNILGRLHPDATLREAHHQSCLQISREYAKAEQGSQSPPVRGLVSSYDKVYRHVAQTLPDSLEERRELLQALHDLLTDQHPAKAVVAAQLATIEAIKTLGTEFATSMGEITGSKQ